MLRVGYGKKPRNFKSWIWKQNGFLMTPCPLNFEIQKYQNEPRSNGVNSRDNLPKRINDGVYVINLDEYADVGTHWIALYVKNIEIIYFGSFGIEHVPKETEIFIGYKSIKNIMFAGKMLVDYTSFFLCL